MSAENSRNRISLPFYPSTTLNFPLSIFGSMLKLWVVLTGTVTISGVTAAGTALGDGGPQNLIKRLRLNGVPLNAFWPSNGIVDIGSRALLRKAQMVRSKYLGEQSGSTLGNGANGAYAIDMYYPIYFGGKRGSQLPISLYTPAYQQLSLEIDTGTVTDCYSGNNGTYAFNLQIQVVDEQLALAPAANPIARVMESHRVPITAVNSRMQDFGLPIDGGFLNMLVMAEQGAQATLSNALINKAEITGNGLSYYKYADDIQQAMLDEGFLDISQNDAGLYYLDFMHGSFQNQTPALGMTTWWDVNNPSGAGLDWLNICTERIFSVPSLS